MQMRHLIRRVMRGLLRLFFRLCTRLEVRGLANLPRRGPLVVAMNHLGHLDGPLIVAILPWEAEAIALIDLYRVPIVGQMLRLYGTIPVQREEFDRTVVRRALAALAGGKPLVLAPEARQSVTGALEKARHGAAYLASRANVPMLPVAITGTEARKAYVAFKHLRRPRITVTVGQPFTLPAHAEGMDKREYLEQATTQIMCRIAAMLPPEYRGYYA